jgi:hypothetical protein
MDRIFNLEQWRLIVVSVFSPVLAFLTPTKGFILALVVAFGLNVICGMRADGISVTRCKNFSFRKFKNAVLELLLYLLVIEAIYTIMILLDSQNIALVVIKSLSYIFIYIYLQNSFKNLINAYPKKMVFRIIYHVLRLEFTRALPSHLQPIIDRVDKEMKAKELDPDNKIEQPKQNSHDNKN